MEKKKLAFIEVAAVWFGTHAGGGFATGNQTKNFFVVGGWLVKGHVQTEQSDACHL